MTTTKHAHAHDTKAHESKGSVTPISESPDLRTTSNPAERDIDSMQTLLKQVTNETGTKSSTDVLLRGVAAQISRWKNDPGKLQEISDKLLDMSTAFADAVTKAA